MNNNLDLEYDRLLGEGSYGKVFLVKQQDGQKFAVKEIDLTKCDETGRVQAHREAEILSRIKQDNILHYIESVINDDCLYIVTEYCGGGDMEDYLQAIAKCKTIVPESLASEWILQLGDALKYLHDMKILHRDMKTKNVFLKEDLTVKLGDLGIAKVLDLNQSKADTFIGTPSYMSPELFSGKSYNHKTDIWGLGCCAYEIMTLKRAFQGKALWTLIREIKNGKALELPDMYSLELRALVQEMMSQDPEDRPSAKDIVHNDLLTYHRGQSHDIVKKLPKPHQELLDKTIKGSTNSSGSGSFNKMLQKKARSEEDKYRHSINSVCEKISTLRLTGTGTSDASYDTFVYRGDSDDDDNDDDLEASGTILDSTLLKQYTEQLDTFVYKGDNSDSDYVSGGTLVNVRGSHSEKTDAHNDTDDNDRTLLRQYSNTLEDIDSGEGDSSGGEEPIDSGQGLLSKGSGQVLSEKVVPKIGLGSSTQFKKSESPTRMNKSPVRSSHSPEKQSSPSVRSSQSVSKMGDKTNQSAEKQSSLSVRTSQAANKMGDSPNRLKLTPVRDSYGSSPMMETFNETMKYKYNGLKDTFSLSGNKKIRRRVQDANFSGKSVMEENETRSKTSSDTSDLTESEERINLSASLSGSFNGSRDKTLDPRLNRTLSLEDDTKSKTVKMKICDKIELSAKSKAAADKHAHKSKSKPKQAFIQIDNVGPDDYVDDPETHVKDVITHLRGNLAPYPENPSLAETCKSTDNGDVFDNQESSSSKAKKKKKGFLKSEARKKSAEKTDSKAGDGNTDNVKLYTRAQSVKFVKEEAEGGADKNSDTNGHANSNHSSGLDSQEIDRMLREGVSETYTNKHILLIQQQLASGIGMENLRQILDIMSMIRNEEETQFHISNLLGPHLYEEYKQHLMILRSLEGQG